MEVLEHFSLKSHNTFGIDVKARYFAEIESLESLKKALKLPGLPDPFILSGGSNMLLTQPLNAFVLYINTKGIEVVAEDEVQIQLKIQAGEVWHELVMYSLEKGYGGLENLALIPGKTGTAPIQNIGAYGVELKDVFESCEALEMATGKLRTFSKEDCRFGYRDSVFKNELKGKFIITSVTLKLTKKAHRLNTSYGAIEEELSKMGLSSPGPLNIAEAVIAIRRSKLPDPARLGNSGSFFKNPVLSEAHYQDILLKHPELPAYRISEDWIKVPAGWLIEKSGYKGKRKGDAGVHTKQALVLVNYGNASGAELLNLAHEIQEAVQKNFGIAIEPEVNII